jgi:MFS family permease
MMGVIMPTGALGQTRLLPRFGARRLVTLGMLLGAVAMLMFTGVTVHSAYATHVLPALLVMGLGLGLVMAPAMSTATLGVHPRDAGVASAMVNTGQQVGGSIGTALLSTLAAAAASGYVADHGAAPDVLGRAAVEGYVTGFWWATAIFALGAVVTAGLLRSGVRPVAGHGAPEPVAA